MGITRLMGDDPEDDRPQAPDPAELLADYLDGLEIERQALIMRLRQIDRTLIKYRRQRAYTLPPRVK